MLRMAPALLYIPSARVACPAVLCRHMSVRQVYVRENSFADRIFNE